MTDDVTRPVDREGLLDAAVASYLQAAEGGRAPDRREWLKRYAEVAGELAHFFAKNEQFGRLAAPLRQLAAAPAAGGDEVDELGRLGDFQLLREAGRGGMGVVYEAEQISLRRRVALKVLPFAATMDPRHLQRFHNEARAAASLDHPHVVHVHAVGSERAVHYYAMQFIEGQSLAEFLHDLRRQARPADTADAGYGTADYQPAPDLAGVKALPAAPTRHGRLSGTRPQSQQGAAYFRRVAEWGVQAAEALEYAHAMGVVHRDVKPANLMLDAFGKLYVTDFGLARLASDPGLTVSGDLVGTLRYMSPEQAMARHGLVDHRTDVYSLAATLYELLTLRPVFGGSDRQELLRQVAFEEPLRPRRLDRGIPAELETVVLKALEKNPAERYATARELAADLCRFLEDRPILARRPTLLDRGAKWARRHRGFVAGAFGILIITVGVLGAAVVLVGRERDEKAVAIEDRDGALEAKGIALQAEQAALARAVTNLAEAKAQRAKAEAHLDMSMEVISSAHNYSNLLKKQGYFSTAAALMGQSVGIQEKMLESYPEKTEYRRALLESFSDLAALRMEMCNFPGVVEAWEKYLKVSGSLGSRALTDDALANAAAGPIVLSDVYGFLGQALRETGQHERAAAAHREAVKRVQFLGALPLPVAGPVYREFEAKQWVALGDVSADLARVGEAEKHYKKALAIWAGLDRGGRIFVFHEGLAHSRLGNLYLGAGKAKEAAECYRLALASWDKSGKPGNILCAWFLATCPDPTFRDPKRAIALAELEVKKSPMDPVALRTLGMAQFRAGRYAEYRESVKRRSALHVLLQPLDFFVQAMARHHVRDASARRVFALGVTRMHQLSNPRDTDTLRVMAEARQLLGIKELPKAPPERIPPR